MPVGASAMKSLKLVPVLQQRVAVPLYSLSFPKKFSIRCRHVQVSRLISADKRRLDLGGMTASIPASASALRSQFALKARSARSLPHGSPQIVGLSHCPAGDCVAICGVGAPATSRSGCRLRPLPSRGLQSKLREGVSAMILVVTPPRECPPFGRLLRNRLPGHGWPYFESPFCALTRCPAADCLQSARGGRCNLTILRRPAATRGADLLTSIIVYSKLESSVNALNVP